MKRWLLLLGIAGFALHARAADPLPPELVGAWKAESTFIILQGDGHCQMFGTAGMGGLATYDPQSRILTLSFRDPKTDKEIGKVTALYEPKALTLTTREKGFEATYKKASEPAK